VIRNPAVWHFGFHSVPDLPELLVHGQQGRYFDFFFDAISADPDAIDPGTRAVYTQGYSRLESLRTGFDWYRTFQKDAADNRHCTQSRDQTPVLYLRGAAEKGMDLERYVGGLRGSGLTSVRGQLIPNSGHFAPDEQPEAVVGLLRSFMSAA
jgi:pimeloyl-ACP methyl ester carboxylesterase